MTARIGKRVWVRDPALADDQVFIKGDVISEDAAQVQPRHIRQRHPPALPARTDHSLWTQITVNTVDGATRAWPKDKVLDVRAHPPR